MNLQKLIEKAQANGCPENIITRITPSNSKNVSTKILNFITYSLTAVLAFQVLSGFMEESQTKNTIMHIIGLANKPTIGVFGLVNLLNIASIAIFGWLSVKVKLSDPQQRIELMKAMGDAFFSEKSIRTIYLPNNLLKVISWITFIVLLPATDHMYLGIMGCIGMALKSAALSMHKSTLETLANKLDDDIQKAARERQTNATS